MHEWSPLALPAIDRTGEERALVEGLERRETRGTALAIGYLAGSAVVPFLPLLVAHWLGGPLLLAALLLPLVGLLTHREAVYRQGPLITSLGEPDLVYDTVPLVPCLALGAPMEATLEKVASRVGAPLPSVVYLSPEVFAAGWHPQIEWGLFSWGVTWIPVLYLGVLPMRALTRDQVEAILAHELGHLSRDPDLLRALRLVTVGLAEGFQQRSRGSRLHRWLNPWCLWTRVCFPWIEHFLVEADRLEELRADQCAARAVGREPIAAALQTYMACMAGVSSLCQANLGAPATLSTELARYFREGPSVLPGPESPDFRNRLQAAMGQSSSSHPSPQARQFLLRRGADEDDPAPRDGTGEGCLDLLHQGGKPYLPMITRWVVQARFALAAPPRVADSPWATCQGARRRYRIDACDEVPRWRRAEEIEAPREETRSVRRKDPDRIPPNRDRPALRLVEG